LEVTDGRARGLNGHLEGRFRRVDASAQMQPIFVRAFFGESSIDRVDSARASMRARALHHSSAETRHSGDETRHHSVAQIVL
jgi:hypothetical protein